jgi:hypothetical protein
MNWVPAELHAGQPRDLVRAFAVDICDRYRVAVNTDPRPQNSGNDRNYIAHVMTTTRVANADGLGAEMCQLARRSSASVGLKDTRVSWAVQVKYAGQVRQLCASMSAFLPPDLLVDADWDMTTDLFIASFDWRAVARQGIDFHVRGKRRSRDAADQSSSKTQRYTCAIPIRPTTGWVI